MQINLKNDFSNYKSAESLFNTSVKDFDKAEANYQKLDAELSSYFNERNDKIGNLEEQAKELESNLASLFGKSPSEAQAVAPQRQREISQLKKEADRLKQDLKENYETKREQADAEYTKAKKDMEYKEFLKTNSEKIYKQDISKDESERATIKNEYNNMQQALSASRRKFEGICSGAGKGVVELTIGAWQSLAEFSVDKSIDSDLSKLSGYTDDASKFNKNFANMATNVKTKMELGTKEINLHIKELEGAGDVVRSAVVNGSAATAYVAAGGGLQGSLAAGGAAAGATFLTELDKAYFNDEKEVRNGKEKKVTANEWKGILSSCATNFVVTTLTSLVGGGIAKSMANRLQPAITNMSTKVGQNLALQSFKKEAADSVKEFFIRDLGEVIRSSIENKSLVKGVQNANHKGALINTVTSRAAGQVTGNLSKAAGNTISGIATDYSTMDTSEYAEAIIKGLGQITGNDYAKAA